MRRSEDWDKLFGSWNRIQRMGTGGVRGWITGMRVGDGMDEWD